MIDDRNKSVASLKTFDPLLNDDIEKDRMVLSLNTMLVTQNVLKNGYSAMDMGRLDKMLKTVTPAFNIAVQIPAIGGRSRGSFLEVAGVSPPGAWNEQH